MRETQFRVFYKSGIFILVFIFLLSAYGHAEYYNYFRVFHKVPLSLRTVDREELQTNLSHFECAWNSKERTAVRQLTSDVETPGLDARIIADTVRTTHSSRGLSVRAEAVRFGRTADVLKQLIVR